MARKRPMGDRREDDGMARLRQPHGYSIGPSRRMRDVLDRDAELLRSEGIDPSWPGFEEPPRDKPKRNC